MSVYFIAPGEISLVKIGYTAGADASRRLKALQTAWPFKLRVRLLIPEGAIELERRLHATFADLRIEGEWFASRGKLDALLNCLDCGFPAVVTLERFYEALSDALFNGKPHPAIPMTDEEYEETGDRSLWPEFAAAYE